jgi:hypothetical protein
MGPPRNPTWTGDSISIPVVAFCEIKLYVAPYTVERGMSENVSYSHPRPEPVAHCLRPGAFHRQVERPLAAGARAARR